MQIDWASFTPWTSLAGGLLIGLAAAWLLLSNGRIAGISGILGGVLDSLGRASPDRRWRLLFLLGLIGAPWLYQAFTTLPTMTITAHTWQLVMAGLLVGVGTRYASGCTSGHGVCGLARLSPRSLAATATFMAAGFATVYIVRHLVGG